MRQNFLLVLIIRWPILRFPLLTCRDEQTELSSVTDTFSGHLCKLSRGRLTRVPKFRHGCQESNSEDHKNSVSSSPHKAIVDNGMEISYQLDNSVPEWENVCSNAGWVKLRFSWSNGRTRNWFLIRAAQMVQTLNGVQSEGRAAVNPPLSCSNAHLGEAGILWCCSPGK